MATTTLRFLVIYLCIEMRYIRKACGRCGRRESQRELEGKLYESLTVSASIANSLVALSHSLSLGLSFSVDHKLFSPMRNRISKELFFIKKSTVINLSPGKGNRTQFTGRGFNDRGGQPAANLIMKERGSCNYNGHLPYTA